MFKQRTLQARWPLGSTLALALALIAFFFLLSERIVTIPSMRAILPQPSIGSQSPSLEFFIQQADRQIKQYGKMDCILVGSSVVGTGIDAKTVEEGYRARAGRAIHCSKLYLPGLSSAFMGDLAAFLIKVYHPHLIVYGSSVRDYNGWADLTGDPWLKGIIDLPWYQYRQGSFTWQGWLVDSSTTYRYYLAARNWMKLPDKPVQAVTIDVSKPLQWEKEGNQVKGFAEFRVNAPALRGLDKLASLNTNGTQIVIVQVPMHPSFALYLPHGQQDFDLALETVVHEAQGHNMPYWRAENLPPLPNDMWQDRIHLNAQGRTVFSRWLGERLALGIQRGEIQDPTRSQKMEK